MKFGPPVALTAVVILLSAAPARAAITTSAAPVAVDYQAQCTAVTAPGDAQCDALRSTAVRQESGASASGGTPAGFGPADLQSAYKLPSGGGAGEIVAVVGAYNDASANSDLAVYRAQYNLPPCTEASGCLKVVGQTGSSTALPPPNAGWGAEDSSDIDAVSAICPLCHIDLVEANSQAISDLGAAENEAVALGARFVTNGWGVAESSADASYDAEYFDHPGVAITAAAGDFGYGTQYPAASQYVTAVGGTSLAASTSPRGWTEGAWIGGGAGCSLYDTKPIWQTDAGCTHRTEVDVAAVADPSTGVAAYTAGSWTVAGGTSVAAAIIAAVYALAGTPPPTSSPAQFPYRHSAGLFDVTTGKDGTCTVSYLCTAGPGYDGPTGLGTPDGITAFTSSGVTLGQAQEVFQGSSGTLWTASSSGLVNTAQSVAPHTSPSLAQLSSGGYEAAFQAPNGDLCLYGPGGMTDTGYGMMSGTDPAIAAAAGGGFDVAFQANTGELWSYSSAAGSATPLGLGMQVTSSPAIAALSGGGYEIAFQANTGYLWATPSNGGGWDLELGMWTGTSPAIAATAGGGFEIAFQANTGELWTYLSATGTGAPLGLTMAVGASPAIAAPSGAGYQIAFEGANGDLWTTLPSSGGIDLGLVMASGTSPGIAALSGGYEIAAQGSSGTLWTVPSNTLVATNLGDPMAPDSSPAIAP